MLRAGRPRGRSSSPGRVENLPLLHIVQTGSEVHPASYPMDAGALSPGVKLTTTQASVEVMKMWIYTCTPLYAFMAYCLIKHRDNFTFLPLQFTADGW
jgi:hypothetical protein